MKFSYQWLSQLVQHGLSPQQLSDTLSMAGLEVSAVRPVAAAFTGVVAAQVESVEAHPDAARLKVCKVNDATGVKQVVCGAANVRPGMYAPLARVGATLGGSDNKDKIKKAKLRGVESHGMLCSAEELGLEEKSDGIMELDSGTVAPKSGPSHLGEDLHALLALDDVSMELDLTPNRGDCLGMLGLAREVAALCRKSPAKIPKPKVKETLSERFPVKITAPEACPRYLGRVLRGVNTAAASPLWLKERLRRSGLRSIDPVVDVTNYILLEYGQPLHAFDLDKLKGGIKVRMAKKGEAITLLDGKQLKLQDDTLVIADQQQAVAMAGIMGGADSAVAPGSSNIMLECAFFSPLAISGRARAYNMQTDASYRYERGVDPAIQHQAMQAATALLQEISGGETGPIEEALGKLPKSPEITLRVENIERLLGIALPLKEIKDILKRLGFAIKEGKTSGSLHIQVPSFRFDVSIEADLIEELARVHGYGRLPAEGGMLPQRLGEVAETEIPDDHLRRHLAALGYQEVISYSFIDPGHCRTVCGEEVATSAPALHNPLSTEMSLMRPSLLPGLLQTLAYNSNRQQERLRLFELGMVFRHAATEPATEGDSKASGHVQGNHIAGLIAGSRYPKNWSQQEQDADFYDIKGDVEALLGERTDDLTYRPAAALPFHSGQCAAVSLAGEVIGHLGTLHPAVQRQLNLPSPVLLFELDLQAVQQARLPRARSLSRQPEVARDLAIVVDEAVAAADILQALRAAAGEHLQQTRIFDVYRDPALGEGKKSIALGLSWRHPSHTLDEGEINAIIEGCVSSLRDKFNAVLRG